MSPVESKSVKICLGFLAPWLQEEIEKRNTRQGSSNIPKGIFTQRSVQLEKALTNEKIVYSLATMVVREPF
jgi:hypothetical protein